MNPSQAPPWSRHPSVRQRSPRRVPILPTLTGPADLRDLTEDQLVQLADEIRETIIATVATTGGHLGSSLGVVELTIALHRLLESPRDRIVWDTGHQAYPHKLLTGRFERFGTLRQIGGVGGFPRRSESEHDVFDGGHAGTGLSIGEGLATAISAAVTSGLPSSSGTRRSRRVSASRPSTTSASERRSSSSS
jgi:deoxyxylulose-5-phosphate synthase